MKHRKLLLIVSLVLALTMSLGGTLAYLTDRDSKTNTFTMGKVDIELKEENFTDGDPLKPGLETDKDAKITNKGSTDAWVWLTVEVPANIKDYVTPVFVEDTAKYTELNTYEKADGTKVYTVLVEEKLVAGQSTDKILDAVLTSGTLDIQDDKLGAVVGGVFTEITGDLQVVVNAYAVQAKGIDSVDKAYEAYHAQWSTGDGGSSGEEEEPDQPTEPEVVIDSAAKLQEEINKGGTVTLTQDIEVETGTITIPANTEVVLDLNEHKLAAEGNANVITNNGTLTIKNGIVYGPTVNYVIINSGDLMIVDTTVENTSTLNVISNKNGANLTVKGASVIKPGIYNKGTLVIEGGTFTFDPTYNKGTLVITGGTFTFNPSQYLPVGEGYGVTKYADGVYVVTKNP